MRVLVTVHYHAPFGGLHANVAAQVRALKRAGHEVSVLCPPGPFAAVLRDLGAQTFEADLTQSTAGSEVLENGPFDVVHAHPFAARRHGLSLAKTFGAPLLLTLHGVYTDSLATYAEEVHLVLTVSAASRDHALAKGGISPERVLVLPNGVDTERFFPRSNAPGTLDQKLGLETIPGARSVLFASRLDTDKQFMLDVVMDTWSEMLRTRTAHDRGWRFLIAGAGTQEAVLRERAATVNEAAGCELIQFLGWQDEDTLAELYAGVDLCLAPGRSALDCMACGTPVIALGSRGYVGVIDAYRAHAGIYGNFGGAGDKADSYQAGTCFADINELIYDDQRLAELGEMSKQLISAYFKQDDLDAQLLAIYASLPKADGHQPAELRLRDPLSIPALSFGDDADGCLATRWNVPPGPGRSLRVAPDSSLRVQLDLAADDKFYIASESTNFEIAPRNAKSWPLPPNTSLELCQDVTLSGGAAVECWLVEYDGQRRVGNTVTPLVPGRNRIRISTTHRTRCFKLGYRFSGRGSLTLAPPVLSKLTKAPPLEDMQRRQQAAPPFHNYAGENLVFVVGTPQSGRTWMSHLLAEHPDVVLATAANLRVPSDGDATTETHIFSAASPFTDTQIKRKFHALSNKHPGKVIVEETPLHLFSTERIRRVFPRAALLLTSRDGTQSDGHAGHLWQVFDDAARRCSAKQHPVEVTYESLSASTAPQLRRILSTLGLATSQVERQIVACAATRSALEERSAEWWSQLSEEDVRFLEQIANDG